MAQQHSPTTTIGADIAPDELLLRWLEADVAAAFEFLRVHAEDCGLGRELTEGLARRQPDRIAG